MKKKKSIYVSMSGNEKRWGTAYLIFQLFALSSLLAWVYGLLSLSPSAAISNFIYYVVNVIALVWIFHRFLRDSLKAAWHNLWELIQAVILGYVAYLAASSALDWLLGLLFPGQSNVNDGAVISMLKSNYVPTLLCVLLFAPLTEELLYRGLIFRNLYQRSRWVGYAVSMVAFSAIHVLGYVGSAAPATLLVCFVQYLPAGLCLAWTYTKADNIFAPMLVHVIANAVALGLVR